MAFFKKLGNWVKKNASGIGGSVLGGALMGPLGMAGGWFAGKALGRALGAKGQAKDLPGMPMLPDFTDEAIRSNANNEFLKLSGRGRKASFLGGGMGSANPFDAARKTFLGS